jgi:hypothetical protein
VHDTLIHIPLQNTTHFLCGNFFFVLLQALHRTESNHAYAINGHNNLNFSIVSISTGLPVGLPLPCLGRCYISLTRICR